ncbi:Ionotropic glutamate receptor, L-glutamate and glycine-binding domain,Receptor, ligand binding [Cinara cedri]|uniref:Ionotropic glutamate receptor, L-glutamate and glycine-binding domain,Receptor, ligand binding n=1 Tax=Cinara cedri TaxID=506608 RepID=A0A5E4MJX4_9HEMI|nr:Ionotropic glutamate receptor, L-glutamate and glycine-binding domain,Receptor, ligand binding [Cinara cedri]
MNCIFGLVSLILVFAECTGETTITLGILYNEENSMLETAFKSSVDVVKSKIATSDVKLNVVSQTVPLYDSFKTQHFVCDMLINGVSGMFGPSIGNTAPIVQSICDYKEIPHIQTRWDINQKRGSCQINLYPHPSTLSKALVDLISAINWESFTIIYENNDSLMQVTNILKFPPTNHPIRIRQLSSGPNYRKELREIKDSGETKILLDCSFNILSEVLYQAQQVGLMGSEHNFIIASLDMHTLDLDPFKYSGTTIIGMRLVKPYDNEFKNIVSQWTYNLSPLEPDDKVVIPETIQVEAALIYDAVQLFTTTIFGLSKEIEISETPTPCNSSLSWKHGFTLINHMKMVKDFKGLTGKVKFDQEGFRTDVELELVDLTQNGLRVIGWWNMKTGINMLGFDSESASNGNDLDLRNKSFVVITALTKPYAMVKLSSQTLEGNDRYEGFGIDLIKELSEMSGFNYTFIIQEDLSSGYIDQKTKKWTGMIGEVINGNADLAIADITITRLREHDVDFTSPFMNLGISILYKKSTKSSPSLFSFLAPFSPFVWLWVITAYCGVSVLLFIMARISPYEWTNPYPCIEEPEYLENQFSMSNAFWFTIGSLMQQGSDIAPIAVSTRLVAGIWWFFTLIMVSSYTANLAAFLTVEGVSDPFKTAEGLVNQNVIAYGLKEKGSTDEYFKESTNPTYKKIYDTLQKHKSWYTDGNDAGVEKVLNENYAFFMESTSIEYMVERNCKLAQIGGLLDNKGYGIVMKKNASYRNTLSANILNLQEKGKLTALKNKWWKEKRGGGACQDTENNEASELSMKNVGGVFIVLCSGVGVSAILAFLEMFWKLWKTTTKEKVSFKSEFKDELKFIAKCRGSTKPARKKQNSSASNSNPTGSNQYVNSARHYDYES